MRIPVFLATLLAVWAATARPAHADVTGFLGANTSPSSRPVFGLAAGAGLLVIGFEGEYARTREDVAALAPSLTTGMGNILIQTPRVTKVQLYVTGGVGFYREAFDGRTETNVGLNTGGGVKIALAAPLRLRIDYRMFTLRGDALHTRPQRIYAGLNLAL